MKDFANSIPNYILPTNLIDKDVFRKEWERTIDEIENRNRTEEACGKILEKLETIDKKINRIMIHLGIDDKTQILVI